MQILNNRYVLSSVTTFVTIFLTTLGLQVATTGIQWTGAFWFSILLVCIRAAIKAVIEGIAGKTADA